MDNLFIRLATRDYIEANGLTNMIDAVDVVSVLRFVIKGNLIPESAKRHYTISKEFERLREAHPTLSKTRIIKEIAERLEVHENTVWNTLKDQTQKVELQYLGLEKLS